MTQVTDRWISPAPQPNGLQAADDGLWLIDQHDNHLYKLDYADGSILARVPTESDHSSGVTPGGRVPVGGLHLRVPHLQAEQRRDHRRRLRHPGQGRRRLRRPHRRPGYRRARPAMAGPAPHVDGRAAGTASSFWLIPRTMDAHRSIPTPGHRPHGAFVAQGHLWCSDVGMRQIHKLDPATGAIRAAIDVPDPEVHGMTLHQGHIWFCCAATRRVCTIPLRG